MRIPAQPQRAAFTLLEVILAMSVAILLMVGLYLAFDIHMNSTEVGRSLVDEANLSRGIFNRITADVNANLGPLDMRFNTAINLADGTNTPIGAAAAAANNPPTTTTTTTTTNNNTPPATPAGTPVTFNLMVSGDSNRLTLYTVTVPRESLDFLKANQDSTVLPPPLSDLRRVTYWLVPGKGLARQEVRMVTSTDDIGALPPDIADDDPNTTFFGAGVTAVQFQYWDGTTWQDSWDGTVLSTVDNVTPQGPPMAIAITVEIPRPGINAGSRTYRHVVAIQTANNLNPTTTTTTTSP